MITPWKGRVHDFESLCLYIDDLIADAKSDEQARTMAAIKRMAQSQAEGHGPRQQMSLFPGSVRPKLIRR